MVMCRAVGLRCLLGSYPRYVLPTMYDRVELVSPRRTLPMRIPFERARRAGQDCLFTFLMRLAAAEKSNKTCCCHTFSDMAPPRDSSHIRTQHRSKGQFTLIKTVPPDL